MKTLYETDIVLWLEEQVKLLRDRKFEELDMDHLLEEIEDLGNQRDTIERLWALTMMHMLKWKYQPDRRCNSWKSSIKGHAKHAARRFFKTPTNKRHVEEFFQDAYEEAKLEAANETFLDLSSFPIECEWSYQQLLDEKFIEDFLKEMD